MIDGFCGGQQLNDNPAVRQDHSHFHSCPLNPGSARHWLVLHTGIASQRKGKLHQAGDPAMPCGSIASVEESPCIIALPNWPAAAPHGSIVTFRAEGKGCLGHRNLYAHHRFPFRLSPSVTWSAALRTPALPLF